MSPLGNFIGQTSILPRRWSQYVIFLSSYALVIGESKSRSEILSDNSMTLADEIAKNIFKNHKK